MERVISGDAAPGEQHDRALRPQTLSEFVGQSAAKGNLKVFIDAARGRSEALDHVLLFGPPGLGIAEINARRAVDQALIRLGDEAELSAVIRAALQELGR